jgi:hypothetical protein
MIHLVARQFAFAAPDAEGQIHQASVDIRRGRRCLGSFGGGGPADGSAAQARAYNSEKGSSADVHMTSLNGLKVIQ